MLEKTRPDQRPTKYVDRDIFSKEKESEPLSDVMQGERLFNLQTRRGRLGFLRESRAYIKIRRRGRGCALNRLCGGVGLNYNFGPSHKKGALGLNDHGPFGWASYKDGGGESSKGITGLERK